MAKVKFPNNYNKWFLFGVFCEYFQALGKA